MYTNLNFFINWTEEEQRVKEEDLIPSILDNKAERLEHLDGKIIVSPKKGSSPFSMTYHWPSQEEDK